jgi:hypothetical protein
MGLVIWNLIAKEGMVSRNEAVIKRELIQIEEEENDLELSEPSVSDNSAL